MLADEKDASEQLTYLQRPDSTKYQSIAHVLARTFKDLYSTDTPNANAFQNLSDSRFGDDEYHEEYIEALMKVRLFWSFVRTCDF